MPKDVSNSSRKQLEKCAARWIITDKEPQAMKKVVPSLAGLDLAVPKNRGGDEGEVRREFYAKNMPKGFRDRNKF